MKKLIVAMLVGSALMLLLGLIGCEGVSGPRGETGDEGGTGTPWQAASPANRYFALGVTNASVISHNGAPKLYLAFDGQHQNAGDTVVCQRLSDGQAPLIDGVDEGDANWGDKYTTVGLRKVAGADNLIDSARVRAAWDSEYIYFQIQWTEIAQAETGLDVSESDESWRWYKRDTLSLAAWTLQKVEEDRLLLMFEVNHVDWFDHDGCFVTCHAQPFERNFHRTNLSKERMDMWSWTAAKSKYTGFADDFCIDNSPILSSFWDVGVPAYILNTQNVRVSGIDTAIAVPNYQHMSDPNANKTYPLWDWEIAVFNGNAGWQSFSTIPAYILRVPAGSTADVEAQGKYEDGTWTVELKRARRTGNGDDAQF